MDYFIWWCLLGVVGVCIITYYDAKHDINSNGHLLEFLTVSFIAGLIVFIFSIFVLVQEFRMRNNKAI